MRDLFSLREAKVLLRLGVPLAGSHIAQFAVQLTSVVMLGWYSAEALAASVLAVTLFFMLFIFGSGFGIAVMPLVAAAAANGEAPEARRAARMGLWLVAFAGVASLPLFLFSAPLFRVLGQDPGLAEAAQGYLRVAGWGIFPALTVMVLKSFLAALEETRIVLYATLLAALLNALLNWAFIFGHWGAPELGLVGAAVASLAAHGLTALVFVVYAGLHPRFRPYALFARFWRPDRAAFARVFVLGWPIGLTGVAENGLFAGSALMMGWLGTAPLAAHGIALEIAAVTFMVHLGLSNAATVRAGQAYGTGDIAGLRATGLTSAALSVTFALMTIAVIVTVPEALVSLFLRPDDPQAAAILALGVKLLFVAALFQLADGGQVLALGLLRGVQDTRVPMLIAVVSYWLIGIPASYFLGFVLGWGPEGVWLGLVVGLAFAGSLLMARFWRGAASARALAAE
jgi:MATE family multidrug resistance protein